MTASEYFKDWTKVIDSVQLFRIMKWLGTVDPESLCPQPRNIFKAFRLCPYNECKAVFLGQDPYPQKGVAQGILFGNSKETPEDKLSPSLQVIKEAVIDYTMPHNVIEFDNTLESWARQGILMLNTALTCEVGKVGSHFNIWKPFIQGLLYNMTSVDSGIVFVLFGNQAISFKDAILGRQYIFMERHPAYYARIGEKLPHSLFVEINEVLKRRYGKGIEFYKETEYGVC